MLVSTLAAQALTAMGKLPDPIQDTPSCGPTWPSTQSICSAMLEQKTEGNLTKDEADMLDSVLHQLRMAFMTIRREPREKDGLDVTRSEKTRLVRFGGTLCELPPGCCFPFKDPGIRSTRSYHSERPRPFGST